MAEHFNALLDGGVRYFGSSIQVGAPDGQAAILSASKADQLKKVNGVEAVFPSYSFTAKPGQTDFSFGVPDQIGAYIPDENRYSALKMSVADGHELTASSRGEVLLGSSVATEFKKKVGDTIELPVRPPDARPDFVSHRFRVVGILNPTRTAPDSTAYVSVRDAQMLFADSMPAVLRGTVDPTQVTQGFTVYGKPGTRTTELDRMAASINRQVPGVKATKPSDMVNAFKQGGATFTAITTAAALLALVIGGLSVVNTMIMAVTERFREIGLKKAVGARTGHILREFLFEAVLIGLIGGVAGYGLGLLLMSAARVEGGAPRPCDRAPNDQLRRT
jgi:putative ABC transport system permease protein